MATHYVYRLWNEADELLYVGISKTLVTRLTQHDATQPWSAEVASVTAKKYPNRDKARAAEIEAIQTEGPRYNIRDRVKEIDWAAEAMSLWGDMDSMERAEAIALMDRFISKWPESWASPTQRALRTALLAAASMMKSGLTPVEALDAIYPDRHRHKSRKLSPCPRCGQEKATYDDSKDYVMREHTAAFTCSPCDVTWTVGYDWSNGRPEVTV